MKRLLLFAASFLCSLFTYATMTGSGTESDPFMIYTADDLNEVRDYVGVTGYYFKLANDIDLSAYKTGEGWEPIGSSGAQFKCVFDGDGHTITNLKINRSSTDYVGLFGYTTSEIKGVNVECDIQGKSYVGGICGYSTSSIIDCRISGTIKGGNNIGGFCGKISGLVSKCMAEVDISASGSYVGGIVGESSSDITICYANGTISSSGGTNIGGIVGYKTGSNSSISDCLFKGSVTGNNSDVGGIVGYQGWSSCIRVFSEASVSGSYNVGGITGQVYNTSLSNSIAANSSVKSGSYESRYGRINGSAYSGRLSSNYSLSTTKVIINGSEVTITDSDKNGTGVSAALLKKESTYASLGWDMDGVWGIDEGTSYPYLRYFYAPEEQTLTFEAPAMTYGDEPYPLPEKTDQGQPISWVSSDANVVSLDGYNLTITGAGDCELIAMQFGGNGYKPFVQSYPLTVSKAPLTITADNFERNAGEENPAFTVTYSGFVYDEDESVLSTLPTITTEATADSPYGDYPISVSGAEAFNYDITYVDGTLTILQTFSLINTLTASVPVLRKGKNAVLSISLDNEDTMVAFELYLRLPAGIHIALDEGGYPDAVLTSARSNRHILEVAEDGDDYYILCYSNNNNALKGNSGELLTVNLVCDDEVEEGVYQGQIHSVKFSDNELNRILLSNVDFDIEVSNLVMADVNGDEEIDVMDVVMMVNYMMGRPSDSFIFAAADHTGDGIIDIMDLVRQVSLVMAQAASNAPAYHNFDVLENGLSLTTDINGAIRMSIADEKQYVATQFVVTLSEGQQLAGITTDRGHCVSIQPMSDNRYFVMSYSADNATFANNAQTLTLNVTGRGTVTVEDATFVDSDIRKLAFQSTSTETTGINEATVEISSPIDIYSVNGILIRRNATTTDNLPSGMYIINNKKLFVK